MANNEIDLLDLESKQTSKQGVQDYSKILDQMKSSLSLEMDPQKRQEILNATLDTVRSTAETDRGSLLEAIKSLTDFQDSIGQQFEGFLKMSDEELALIKDAERRFESAKQKLGAAEQELLAKQRIPDNWWQRLWGRNKKILRAENSVVYSKNAVLTAESDIESAKEQANIIYRQRIESATMETLLDEYQFRSEKTVQRLKDREGEIKEIEEGLVVAIGEASQVHEQALKYKEQYEEKAEQTKTELHREQEALNLIVDKQTPEYAAQVSKVAKLEQRFEEESGKVNSYMNLASSKDSFVQKHNLTIKTLTNLRSNLQSHRTKLASDTKERIQFYQGYVVALKARNDQELATVLEKLGNKTDENVASTLAQIMTASSKARQTMMEDIPVHERNVAEILSAAAESLAAIRKKDKELIKNWEDHYGIDLTKTFEKTYEDGGNNDSSGKDDNVKPEGNSNDLLG